jgi:hypothetical protein
MSKRKSTTILANRRRVSKSQAAAWDKAIADANEMIREVEDEATRLRHSVRSFQELRDSGAAFPGHSSLESVHTT